MNKPLDPTEQAIAEKVLAMRDEASSLNRASATALPGPLADAFAIAQDIVVGPYRIRAFFDIDYEFFAMLKHPLDEFFKQAVEGKEPDVKKFLPSGMPAWQSFFIMTTPVDDIEKILQEPNGVEELNKQAKAKFSRLQPRALAALFEAVMKQINISNSTAVEHGPALAEGEKEPKKANP